MTAEIKPEHKIVILHGWMDSSKSWITFLDQLKNSNNNARVIELPGFGKEKLINNKWGIPEYAEWVKNRVEQKKEKNIILLGHSFGGRIAAYLAAQQPNWLKALILYAAPVLYRPSKRTKNKIKLFKILKKIKFLKSLKKHFYTTDLKQAEESGMDKIFRKTVSFDQTNLLPEIKVPTLLIWGTEDSETNPNIADEAHKLIPKSKLIKLANMGHYLHLENPNIFYGKIIQFIKNLK